MNKTMDVNVLGLRATLHRTAIFMFGLGIVAAAYSATRTPNIDRTSATTAGAVITLNDKAHPATLAALAPITAAASMSAAAVDPETRAGIVTGYGKLPIRFEPNVGQASSSVKYLARGGGYSVGLTGSGAILSLRNTAAETVGKPDVEKKPAPVEQAWLRMSLVNAKAQPRLVTERPLESYSNYFIGNDRSKWHSNVANYGAVRYQQVYPGIDWVVYGNPQQLEYDLVVAPSGDPKQIKLKIEGTDGLALDTNGDLLVKVKNQTLRQLKPVIYQTTDKGDKQTIEGHYVLDHQQVAFAVGDYDHSRRLVIDPVLAYSTYLGGSGGDEANAIAVDNAGNAYVAGETTSTDFPTASPLQGANAGGSTFGGDVFVSKLNAAGSALVYSTYLGGSGADVAYAIAVDSTGNAYVAGETSSINFPTVSPLQSAYAFGFDGFVAKLNAAGSALVYSTYLGGGSDDQAFAIAVDSAGNAYVAGYTYSTDFPTANPLRSANAGREDAFVSKLNVAGSALVYSTYLGGSGHDEAFAIAVDGAGNVYVAGYTTSTDFPTAGPLQNANAGGNDDAFVAKLNAAGSALVYSTYLGGSGDDLAYAIAVDSAGNAYVAGYTTSTDFPTASPLQSANAGGSGDAYISKLNAAGSALVYSTYLGGGDTDFAKAIAVDGAGNAYIAGFTYSTDFPIASPLQSANAGGSGDAYISKLNAAGSALSYSTYLGGSDSDSAEAIAVDNAGNAYVAGSTHSTDFPTASPLQSANAGGGGDAFVSKIMVAASTPTMQLTMSPSFFIRLGKSVTLTWSTQNATDCTASGNWSGSEPANGSDTLTPTATGANRYTLICTGPDGTVATTQRLWVFR